MTQWILISLYFKYKTPLGSITAPKPDVYYVGITSEPKELFNTLKSYSPCHIAFYCCFEGDEAKRDKILQKFQAKDLESGFVYPSKEFESFLFGLRCGGENIKFVPI